MANKTSFKAGQSGNPNGRPPKCRVLSDILEQAGNAKAIAPDGSEMPRKRVLAEMIWLALMSWQLRVPKDNRGDSDRYGTRPVERVYELTFRDWWTMVTWLYAQIDPEVSMSFDSTKGAKSEDGPAPGATVVAPILYIPDNRREAPKTPENPEAQAPETPEPGQNQAG